jgi:membrane protein implicated in regulation of membrane protease activity
VEFDPQLNTLLLEADFWYLVGIGLVIIEVIIGLEFFVLAFGIGAILTGATIDLSLLPSWLVYWERTILVFSVLSLATLLVLKKLIPKGRAKKDINDY